MRRQRNIPLRGKTTSNNAFFSHYSTTQGRPSLAAAAVHGDERYVHTRVLVVHVLDGPTAQEQPFRIDP